MQPYVTGTTWPYGATDFDSIDDVFAIQPSPRPLTNPEMSRDPVSCPLNPISPEPLSKLLCAKISQALWLS
jgi:hypothetical protein